MQTQTRPKIEYTGQTDTPKLAKIQWKNLPDPMSKEQFYKLCHISKSTALYLLQSGKVPCITQEHSRTRYLISQKDAKFYLKHRKITPEYYLMPDGWRKALATQHGNLSTQNAPIVENDSSRQKLATQEVPSSIQCQSTGFYQRKLQAYPRLLLTIDEICSFTGYSRKTVLGWLHKSYFAAAKINGQHFIPKQGLVLFFCSVAFRGIRQKSRKHQNLLKAYRRTIR